jgi:hypothetical protein
MHQYDTVTSAINGLRERGFTEDFNLQENCLICNAQKFTRKNLLSQKFIVLKVIAIPEMKQSCMA